MNVICLRRVLKNFDIISNRFLKNLSFLTLMMKDVTVSVSATVLVTCFHNVF